MRNLLVLGHVFSLSSRNRRNVFVRSNPEKPISSIVRKNSFL
ncbi:hypothetical protein LEP1GSC187_2481 [Leptospira santarosai str. ZUN179]|uniref:Uncharacterized protein n=1 Tax=Leptospira santarosai str. ZUN179 TaxID=1049985 RepID=M6V2H7_9LEPT|nr:hypothetical protein LEP1GSC187_2481 [Leptospira santarosai str. ZUN179]